MCCDSLGRRHFGHVVPSRRPQKRDARRFRDPSTTWVAKGSHARTQSIHFLSARNRTETDPMTAKISFGTASSSSITFVANTALSSCSRWSRPSSDMLRLPGLYLQRLPLKPSRSRDISVHFSVGTYTVADYSLPTSRKTLRASAIRRYSNKFTGAQQKP